MKQQVKENVSVDFTLQNHGYVETSELWSGFWDFCDSPGTHLECQVSDDFESIHFFQLVLSGEAYCSLCSHCWFYDVTTGCILTECTYRPYRKEADDVC